MNLNQYISIQDNIILIIVLFFQYSRPVAVLGEHKERERHVEGDRCGEVQTLFFQDKMFCILQTFGVL